MSDSTANFPTSIDKRDILFGVKKMSAENLKAMAQRFAEAGWMNDAVDFYAQAKDQDSLRRVRTTAVKEGDTFLFLKISRALGETEVPVADLRQCSENAETLGKLRYAMRGFEKLGDTARHDAIRTRIAGDGDIVAIAESKVFIPDAQEEPETADEE